MLALQMNQFLLMLTHTLFILIASACSYHSEYNFGRLNINCEICRSFSCQCGVMFAIGIGCIAITALNMLLLRSYDQIGFNTMGT